MAGTERDRKLIATVRDYIASHSLLSTGQFVTVALSGGADSVCLLLLLRELGYHVHAAHCNFHLRGEESERDQQFVEELCSRIGVELHIAHFDTQAEAERTGQSLEMVARELRYRWFATLQSPIAIAHHRDDNVETMLLNLVRGTGLRGLCGIQPSAQILGASVIRPLLCISRQQILDFLALRGQSYVVDSTNLEAVARRNIIRLQVLPLLATINPSVSATLQDDIERFAEEQKLIDESLQRYAATATNAKGEILVQAIDACPAPLTLLHHLLNLYGFTAATISEIFAGRHGHSGATYNSATHCLLRHNSRFILREHESAAPYCAVIPSEGQMMLPDNRYLKVVRRQMPVDILRDSNIAMLDADRLAFPLTIRRVQPADRFRPFGMRGTKLVSDFLTDLHLNLFDKQSQLVVTSGDEIVWVVGYRISQVAAITSATQNVLQLYLVEQQ